MNRHEIAALKIGDHITYRFRDNHSIGLDGKVIEPSFGNLIRIEWSGTSGSWISQYAPDNQYFWGTVTLKKDHTHD